MIAENGESEGGRRIESSGLEEPARRRWYGSSFRRSGTHVRYVGRGKVSAVGK